MKNRKKLIARLLVIGLGIVLTLISPKANAADNQDEILLQQKNFCLALLYGNQVPNNFTAADEASIVSCMLNQSQPTE
ncbi:MAG: hypothetical protein KDD44_14030 [Bdellovibrionales bacterium]|nr:hypothetical protein [Bdellovibrionales bacterium]MCB0416575.1 hypothetical protein [Bdellovibrionales bacterium]MCB9253550.1 hypothetical protein [Pseudobdellovibrionaceae bacterium]